MKFRRVLFRSVSQRDENSFTIESNKVGALFGWEIKCHRRGMPGRLIDSGKNYEELKEIEGVK